MEFFSYLQLKFYIDTKCVILLSPETSLAAWRSSHFSIWLQTSRLVYFSSSSFTPTSSCMCSSICSFHNSQNMSCFCWISFSHMDSLLKCSFSPGTNAFFVKSSDSCSLMNYPHFQYACNKFGKLCVYNLLLSLFWCWHKVQTKAKYIFRLS